MKTITFKRHTETVDLITFTIQDEDTFKEKLKQHLQDELSVSFWDIEEDVEEWGVSEFTYDETHREEEYDHFYEVMREEGYPTDDEDIEMLNHNQENQ